MDIDLLAMIFWLVWNRRNATRTEESVLDYHQIQAIVDSYLLEFKSAKVCERKAVAEGNTLVRWGPPSPNYYKINFDGADFSEVEAAGLGIVIFEAMVEGDAELII